MGTTCLHPGDAAHEGVSARRAFGTLISAGRNRISLLRLVASGFIAVSCAGAALHAPVRDLVQTHVAPRGFRSKPVDRLRRQQDVHLFVARHAAHHSEHIEVLTSIIFIIPAGRCADQRFGEHIAPWSICARVAFVRTSAACLDACDSYGRTVCRLLLTSTDRNIDGGGGCHLSEIKMKPSPYRWKESQ